MVDGEVLRRWSRQPGGPEQRGSGRTCPSEGESGTRAARGKGAPASARVRGLGTTV